MAMDMYIDEEEVWKCPKHPSKRRKSGICPTCLRERLNSLCPQCHQVRPCTCSPPPAETDTDSEPSLHRSRSVGAGLAFLRSRFGSTRDQAKGMEMTSFLWRKDDKSSKSTKRGESEGLSNRGEAENEGGDVGGVAGGSGGGDGGSGEEKVAVEERRRWRAMMMRKSRSVAVTSEFNGGADLGGTTEKKRRMSRRRRWYMAISPMRVFRQSKMAKVFGHGEEKRGRV